MQRRKEELRTIRKRQARNDSDSWQWRLTFCGQRMGHNYYAYYMIDQIMIQNPQIKGIVEIGTAHGALTTVLGLWGIKRNIPVLSLDRNGRLHDKTIFDRLGIEFIEADENSEMVAKKIIGMCHDPIFIYCDGGNKPREFNDWAPIIRPGSVIAVHDWGVEIGPEDVNESIELYGFEPFMPERWERMNVQMAIWTREESY
jgi:cephalosporin hydroxylase